MSVQGAIYLCMPHREAELTDINHLYPLSGLAADRSGDDAVPGGDAHRLRAGVPAQRADQRRVRPTWLPDCEIHTTAYGYV